MKRGFFFLFFLLSLFSLNLHAVNPHTDSKSKYLQDSDTATVYKEFTE